MPLDTNIALSLKPLQLNDPLETQVRRQQVQSNALAMRNAESQNALAQRTALEDQAVNKLYAQSYDPQTGRVDMRRVMEGAAQLGLGGKILGMQNADLEAQGKRQNITKDFNANVSSAMDNARFRLEGVRTPDQFMQWHEQNHSDPTLQEYFDRIGVTPEQSRAQIAAAASDPAAFADLLQKAQLGLKGAQDAVNAQANRDTQLEVQGMIGQRMDANRAARPAAPARAATGGGAAPATAGAPAAAGKPSRAGKAPPDPTVVAAAQDEKIGRIRGALKEADELIGPTTTGVIGEVASRVGGTKARDLSGKLETIKANLGFDELQKMRDASPTGGALGQVAVKELIALQATVASLDQGLSPTELKKSIKKIEQHYNAWYEAVLKARSGAQPAAAAASPNAKLYDEADAILNRGRK
jgi:hypothetical protein